MTWFVNGEAIDEAEIKSESDRLRPHYEQVFGEMSEDEREAQLAEWSRENVIERLLLRQAAVADPEPIDVADVDKQLAELFEHYGGRDKFFEAAELDESREGEVRDDIEKRIRIERLLNSITEAAPKPTEENIKTVHSENPERFTSPEMIHAAHIVKHPGEGWDAEAARAEMEINLKKLTEGVNFEFLAGQSSDCSDNGGDLGYFPRGQMVEAFENVVFNMADGEISDVFETEFGLHIAKVYERRAETPITLEEARETIEQELTEQAKQQAVETFIDAQREKSTIEQRA